MSQERFKEAFLKGLDAADLANRNRQDVEEAIQSFAKDVEAAVDGGIRVYLDATIQEKTRMLGGYLSAALGEPEVIRTNTHGIFAQVKVDTTSGPTERLCLVKFAPMTYPVEIQWVNDTRLCSSTEAVLSALEALIEDPDTGKKFRRLMAARDDMRRSQSG